uniref:YqaJ viral recombinase domain-containing protein n=1 Tax=Panagrolaimus sp. ES5 TaxID=591445 RepID=A0AC34G090_9BILA
MKEKASDQSEILKYLIQECKRKSVGDFLYKPWKTEEEKIIHLLTNATLNSIKTKEEAELLGKRYQMTAEIRKNGLYGNYFREIPILFRHNTSIGPKALLTNFELCNYDVLPRIGTYSSMFDRFSLKCFPCKCLNPRNIKCEESISLEKCVANNQWVAGFTKFDNLTNDLLEVKCCKYIYNTHTLKVSNEIVNKFHFTYEFCQNNFELSSPNSISYINNIAKESEK